MRLCEFQTLVFLACAYSYQTVTEVFNGSMYTEIPKKNIKIYNFDNISCMAEERHHKKKLRSFQSDWITSEARTHFDWLLFRQIHFNPNLELHNNCNFMVYVQSFGPNASNMCKFWYMEQILQMWGSTDTCSEIQPKYSICNIKILSF